MSGAARRHASRGFTLVEVLVALVVVGIGAASVLAALNTAAQSTSYLRERTFASWIAANRMVELRVATTPPTSGTRRGELDYAGERWAWQQVVEDTQIPGVRRVEISTRRGAVPASEEQDPAWTITIEGTIGRDLARPNGTVPDWDGSASRTSERGAGGATPDAEAPPPSGTPPSDSAPPRASPPQAAR